MSRRWPWCELKLEPTDDASAIRRAYAKRLRAIDPDQDPAAFMALREARDGALDIAANGNWGEEEIAGYDAEAAEWAPAMDVPLLEVEPEPDRDAHFRGLGQMLFGNGDPDEPMDEEQEAEALALLGQVFSDPRLEEIGFYADAENWLAELLARSIPRSDPLLAPAAERFGWEAIAGQVDEGPAVAEVNDRLAELRFLVEVQAPRHPHHRAWRELTTPADERSRKGWGVGHGRVNDLLQLVRSRYPRLEGRLDWYRVAMWESPPAFQFKGWWVGFALIIVFQVARCAANFTDVNPGEPVPGYGSSSSYVPSLLTPTADIDVVLERLFGDTLTVSDVQAKNPELYTQLKGAWKKAKAAGQTPARFQESVETLLLDRYDAAVDKAGYALVSERRRLLLEEAKWLQASQGAQACADFLMGEAPETLPDEYRRRERAVMARTLLEVTGPLDPPETDRRFRLSGTVVADVARRSGLDKEAVAAALTEQGPASARCKARIALMEAALALPGDEGLALLRKL